MQRKGIVDRLWDFFASVRLAIVLFLLIAGTSVVGTVIEQNAPAEKNLKVLSKLFGESVAPKIYKLLYALDFTDMYHSWWFVTLLVLFSINLIVCSIDRLPRILNLARQPIRPLDSDRKRFPIRVEAVVKGSPESVRERALKGLKSLGFNAENSPMPGGFQLYSQKGGWTRLGVYVTHLSILIILIGAVIGIFFGFKGFVNLPEGYTSDKAYSYSGVAHDLGFSIRCDDFEVEFYGASDMPKDYKSWLTIIKDGSVVKKKMIEVNSPLKFEGYTFYQSSYGPIPEAEPIVVLKITGPSGTETVAKRPGETFVIPGTDIEGIIKDYSPALGVDSSGKTFTYTQMMNNPAVYLEFKQKDKPLYSGWVLKRFPRTWQLPDGNRVQLVDLWGLQYTGLQIRKDPGVWIVYLGSIVMAIGLIVSFFMSHKRIWLFLNSKGKNQTFVVVLATSNKNREAFRRKIEHFVAKLQTN